MHAILCDEIDSGKSSFVLSLASRLVEEGFRLSGWMTPAFIDGGKKRGHDFVGIDRGRIDAPIPFTRLHPFEGSVQFPGISKTSGPGIRNSGNETACPYNFNAKAFEQASHLAASQVSSPESRVTDLFVMDEIGPLELALHEGFYEAMICAYKTRPSTLTVIRKGLCEDILCAAPNLDFTVYPLSETRALERVLRGEPFEL